MHFIIVMRHKYAPELSVTIGPIYANNAIEAKMKAQQYMFSNNLWEVIDCAEVQDD